MVQEHSLTVMPGTSEILSEQVDKLGYLDHHKFNDRKVRSSMIKHTETIAIKMHRSGIGKQFLY